MDIQKRLEHMLENCFKKLPPSNVKAVKERIAQSASEGEDRRNKQVAREYAQELRRLQNLEVQALRQYIQIIHMLIEGKLDKERDARLTQVCERLDQYTDHLNELRQEAMHEII